MAFSSIPLVLRDSSPPALTTDVIIPAFNEENAIGRVLGDIPRHLVQEIIVYNNGSRDRTAEKARDYAVTVLDEPSKGYGSACLRGINYISAKPANEQPDLVVFMDADYSDFPQEMELLIAPIQAGIADLVIGSRAIGQLQPGSMTIPQVFGNWLATRLIRFFYQVTFTDLGPFRAITWPALRSLDMRDRTYGWTVEMQVKAAKKKLRCTEVPVSYRPRIGKSKVSGTVKGTILAGYKILWTIFKYL